MTRKRLRPKWSDNQLAEMYPEPHNHLIYGRGHGERVQGMIDIAKGIRFTSIADLSCGNAHVVFSLIRDLPPGQRNVDFHLGDIAPGYSYCGPIEETIRSIPYVDVFVSGETLEHLDDPQHVLNKIREKCSWLVLSTPVDNWGDTNAEHYWSWAAKDVADMLLTAGFDIVKSSTVDSRTYGEPYCYGIWLCK